MTQTLSSTARRRARALDRDQPQDATVTTAPTSRDELVAVRLARGREAYLQRISWVSNGRLPAVGDLAVVITTPSNLMAMVWATGEAL